MMKSIYNAQITNSGGRNGQAYSTDGSFEMDLKESSPEQLFAAALATSFNEVLLKIAAEQALEKADEFAISVQVSLQQEEEEDFLEIELDAFLPGLEKEQAAELLQDAYELCPFSQSVSENVDFHLHLLMDE